MDDLNLDIDQLVIDERASPEPNALAALLHSQIGSAVNSQQILAISQAVVAAIEPAQSGLPADHEIKLDMRTGN